MTKQRLRLTELQRRLKNLIAAAQAVERCLAIEDGNATLAPDRLLEEVDNATRTAFPKNH